MLEIPKDWAACMEDPRFITAQKRLYQVVAEKRQMIRESTHIHMQKGFIRGARPASVIPTLGCDKEEEKDGCLDLCLAGFIRRPPIPIKGEPQNSSKKKPSYEYPVNNVLVVVDPDISKMAFDRLTPQETTACMRLAYSERQESLNFRYKKEEGKMDRSFEKLQKIARNLDRLQEYYSHIITLVRQGKWKSHPWLSLE